MAFPGKERRKGFGRNAARGWKADKGAFEFTAAGRIRVDFELDANLSLRTLPVRVCEAEHLSDRVVLDERFFYSFLRVRFILQLDAITILFERRVYEREVLLPGEGGIARFQDKIHILGKTVESMHDAEAGAALKGSV